MRRTVCLIGVSLMFCFGQHDASNIVAIPDWIVEVGLPIQLSVEPVDGSSELPFRWLHSGRYLAYATDATNSSTRLVNLHVYHPRTNRNQKITSNSSAYQFSDRSIYYIKEQEMENELTRVVVQYNPTVGRERVLYTVREPVPEEPPAPCSVRLEVSPKERLLLMKSNRESVLLDIQTGKPLPLPSPEVFIPTNFYDDQTLEGYRYGKAEDRRLESLRLHLPSGEIIPAGGYSLRPTPVPQSKGNLELRIEQGALYLISKTSSADRHRRVFLTRDYSVLFRAPVMVMGTDEAVPPALEEPLPRAEIAPDESGMVIVSVHDQLYYVPLTKRQPADMTEAIACGEHPDEEMLRKQFLSNAKVISLALMMYVQDWEEHFPFAGDVPSMIMPYIKNEGVFRDPITGQMVFRYLLNGESFSEIENPALTQVGVLDWGHPTHVVAIYADGHVKFVPRQ